ncbi:hypothetical protein HJ590_03020 [Naumannella sp. ID2617S]|nr:hypothetical protein [Naumannella sp. ID2617S]
MRIYRQPIEVHVGLVDGIEGPAEFRWQGRQWQVEQVQARWVLTAPWWESPAARAVRDGGVRLDDPPDGSASPDDLLAERVGWRVVAGRGSASTESRRSGVFELHHATATGWWLDRVID